MKIWTILLGVKLQPDQHPKTPVIHKVGGYGSGSDISRGLYALTDIWDGGNRKYCIAIFGSEGFGGGFGPLPRWMNLYCAPWSRRTSAISQSALLSFISSSMPLIALLFGIRLPSGRRQERSR